MAAFKKTYYYSPITTFRGDHAILRQWRNN
jgi:hypothetical protein